MTTAATLHDRVRRSIVESIASGGMSPHARVHSERELCERHGVSRTTARRAIADLVNEGVLYTVSGKGTFVAERPLRQELRLLVGFREDLESQGLDVRSKVLALKREEASTEVAATLGIRLHAPVIRLSRLRISHRQPLAIQTSVLPEHLCPGLHRLDFTDRSLFGALREDYGMTLVGGDTIIKAGLADPQETRLLRLPSPASVLRTEQVTHQAGGEAIEYCRSSFHGEHFELSSTTGQAAGTFTTIFSGGEEN